ncbi:MFS family permease [Microbacterium sp. SORGH_AS 1204]|nr:MFS family permease [Microbacterium sp. SORGH_AS_1204]
MLILLALFIRMRLRETPTFIELEKSEQIAERPIRDIFTRGLPGVIVGIGLRMAENGGSYMFNTLALTFFVASVGGQADRSLLTWGVTLGSLIGIFSVPLTGALSDRMGRRTVYRAGALFMLLFTFPAWWLMSLGNYPITIAVIAIGIGVAVTTPCSDPSAPCSPSCSATATATSASRWRVRSPPFSPVVSPACWARTSSPSAMRTGCCWPSTWRRSR